MGRYSGHSLLNNLQRRGIDDQSVEVSDKVPEQFRTVASDPRLGWRNSLTAQQQAQLKLKAELVEMDIENIKAKYQMIGEIMGGFRSRDRIMLIFDQILQQNKEQNRALNDLYKDSITNGKSIRKVHEYVTKQTEKYIKEMENSLK